MTPQEILERIISEEGSCDWIQKYKRKAICSKCPLSKLKRRPDGQYLCCMEALGITVSEELRKKADHIYKRTAESLLFDMIVEEMLNGTRQK
jgi:hypothetical protein